MQENIKGYSIKKQLGFGGMSKVYLAYDPKLKRNIAIKILSPSYSADKRITKRFVKEARTAAQLQHSNIISIYDVGKHKDQYYIAMEYLKESLKDKINKGNLKNDPEAALKIVKKIAEALLYAHKKGFIHRDIKPDNVMFRDDGTLILLDFGIVKALRSESNLTRTGMSVGTPKYMSPEQMRAKKVDERSDIYSLGIVLYEILTGTAPYKTDDLITLALRHAQGPVPELPRKYEYIQPLLNKMIAKKPFERVRDCEGLIRLIDALLYRIKNERTGSVRKYEMGTGKTSSKRDKMSNKGLTGLILALILITVLITASIFLIREANLKREHSGWEKAKEAMTIPELEKYLESYPDGIHSEQAKKILNNLKKENQEVLN
ncbi:MAG: serine/threonine protein kinase [Candidatus Aminicenantes bacterium]|nr:serine/threonine protein kinase [Candidatus Aminicenantes bacterium]